MLYWQKAKFSNWLYFILSGLIVVPVGTAKAGSAVEKNFWGIFPTTVSSFQRTEMESGLEHRCQVHLGKRTANRAEDKAAYRAVPSSPSKSSPLARAAGERIRTTTRTRTQIYIDQCWGRDWWSQTGLKWGPGPQAGWWVAPGEARQEQSGLVVVSGIRHFFSGLVQEIQEDSKNLADV